MGAVNFYLKKAEQSTGKSLIYLKFKYNGLYVLVWTFGQTVCAKNWNKSKQRVKSNNETTADGQHSLNDLLDNLEKVCKHAYNTELKNGIPTPDVLKKHLTNFLNQNKKKQDTPTLFSLIDRFISGEIKHRGKAKSKETLRRYTTQKNRLLDFQAKKKYRIDFDTINLEFFYKYVSFLKDDNGLAQNTIAKAIDTIVTFMNEAVDLGYTTNLQYKNKKFSVSWEETDSVYLKEKELIKLYNHDFTGNKKLEQVRDLFVFGSFVGLRFSDFSNVKPENIVEIEDESGKKEYYIRIITTKTRELVIIPCNPIILEIFEKYKSNPNRLPRSISNQKFNDYIKDACKEAKLIEKGRLSTDPSKELWECISSHTARRNFATNYYLQGFPTIDLMRITGHKTEKAFLTYIKVSKLDAAKRLNEHIKRSWEKKILRAA